MAQQQYDNNNTGMLHRNHRREDGSKQPDMSGFVNIEGIEYWVSGWTKDTPRGGKLDQAGVTKFVSLSIKPKEEASSQRSSDRGRDEQRYERQPERAARAPAREERQPARAAPAKAGAFDVMDDDIPF